MRCRLVDSIRAAEGITNADGVCEQQADFISLLHAYLLLVLSLMTAARCKF